MLFLKTFKDAKFVVDGNAFQTFIILSTNNMMEKKRRQRDEGLKKWKEAS